MMNIRKIQLLAVALLSLGLAIACTSKKKSGGGSKEKSDEGDEASDPIDTGTNTNTETGCTPLRLTDDLDEGEEEAGEEEAGEEEAGEENTDTDTSSTTDPSTDPTAETTSGGCGETVTPSGGGAVTDYDVGPGIEGCKEQGAVWIAVTTQGSEKRGACGDPLADFCCTEDNIKALFPSMASQIGSKFDGYKSAGLMLYGCSASAGKYSFHWAISNDSGISYKSTYVTGVSPKAGVQGPAQCPAVSIEDLGFAASSTDTEEETDTETGTGTGPGVGTGEIPEKIGPIDDTSEAGILAWLQEKGYQSWSSKRATWTNSKADGTSPHGDVSVKIYYSAKLKSSDDGWKGSTKKHKVDSIAVLEFASKKNANFLDQPKGWAVMAKAHDEEGKDSWLFFAIKGTAGTFPNFTDGEQKGYGLGVESCATCHGDEPNQRDFITTRAP